MSNNISNTLQLHYYLDNGSHEMNAFSANRCSYEALQIIAEIARKFNVQVVITTFPCENGGLIQWLKIVKKNEDKSAPITTEVIKYLVVGMIALPFYIGDKVIDHIMNDDSLDESQKEEYCDTIRDNGVNLSSSENKITKLRSNFYSSLEEDKNVNKVELSSFDGHSNLIISKSVSRASFPAYILTDNALDPVDIDEAIIFITAPVIAKGSYTYWHGKYNGEDIKFKMNSNEFKTKVQQGEVSFKNGFSINCLLRIHKVLTDNGDERVRKYEVVRVNNYFITDKIIETNEGRTHRIKKERDNEPHLFSDIEE